MSLCRSQRKRRDRLWHDDPHCRYCGKLTWLPKERPQGATRADMATLDHLDSRISGRRGSHMCANMPRTTLACAACNTRRSDEEILRLADDDASLRRRLGSSVIRAAVRRMGVTRPCAG